MQITSPYNLYLRFEKSFKNVFQDEEKRNLAQRVTVSALPYLALIPPAGYALSIGTSGLRTFGEAVDLSHAWKAKATKKVILAAIKTTIAAYACFVVITKNPLGLVITTSMDIAGDVKNLFVSLKKQQYQQAFESMLHGTASSFFLATMLYGSLEIIAISMTFQTAVAFYQSGKEFKKGRWIEGASHFGIGAIKSYQTVPLIRLVKRKWTLFRKFADIRERLKQGEKEAPKKNNPIENMAEYADENAVVISDSKGETFNLGAYISEIGGKIVKGMVLCLRNRIIEGKSYTEVDFKVNHVFREAIEPYINELGELQTSEFKEFLNFAGIPTTGMKVEKVPFEYLKKDGAEWTHEDALKIGEAYSISLPGVGQILLGASNEVTSFQDRIVLQVETGNEFEGARTLLSLLGIAGTLAPSSKEEIERLKIGQLFQIFYPDKAQFENTSEFFNLNVDSLKEKIISLAPGMKEHFENDLKDMKNFEILPGYQKMGLSTLAEKAKEAGGCGLLMGIGNAAGTNEQACEQLATILDGVGPLSSEARFASGMNIHGDSSVEDHKQGSSGYVFTRMLVESQGENPTAIDDIPLSGKIQIILDIDAIETGTYQYHLDNFGSRETKDTKNPLRDFKLRDDIITFIEKENANYNIDNEVMIKHAIPPQHIKGCLVDSVEMKENLIAVFTNKGLITTNDAGEKMINSIPLDQFISVKNTIDQDVLSMARSSC